MWISTRLGTFPTNERVALASAGINDDDDDEEQDSERIVRGRYRFTDDADSYPPQLQILET